MKTVGNLRKSGVWGDQKCAYALARLLKVHVHIICADYNLKISPFDDTETGESSTTRQINLGFVVNHFYSIRDAFDNSRNKVPDIELRIEDNGDLVRLNY